MSIRTEHFFVCFVVCVFVHQCLSEGDVGDNCKVNGREGVCTNLLQCSTAIEDLKQKNTKDFKICGFIGNDAIICCLNNTTTTQLKSEPVTRRPSGQGYCEPSSPRRPDMKFGRIAYDKCIDYQGEVVLPCTLEYLSLTSDRVNKARANRCHDEPPPLVVGGQGVDAKRGEFAHMALLGYGPELSAAQWLCGGSVISEWFILTAGHCTSHEILGPVEHIRLGILKRSDPTSKYQFFKVKRIVKHPDFHPPSKYNDIALLETDRQIKFTNKFISPACLDVGLNEVVGSGVGLSVGLNVGVGSGVGNASATGWGALAYDGDVADVLQRLDLEQFSDEECASHFGTNRLLKQGFNSTTQLCYGHRVIPRDTCQGDSGGPLQSPSSLYCMQSVVGITSFGRACGVTGQPGVYTRVKAYVPWIEGVVWPQQLVFASK